MMFIECSFLPGSHSTKGFKIKRNTDTLCVCVLITQSCPILCNPMDYGEGNGTPLQYSCLENTMDRGAW